MLIKALCDYYDQLAADGEVLPDGYSKVKYHYLVCLTPNGEIAEIVNKQVEVQTTDAKGKVKTRLVPAEIQMPLRTEKTGIDANIIEHRPLYLFGLNFEDNKLTPTDKTKKAEKSHNMAVEVNLKFIEDINSPVVNAYRAFLENWQPENETENPCLISLGKAYKTASFVFCLNGRPDLLLHEDMQVKEKWERLYMQRNSESKDDVIAQCGITGENEPIARIHNKIKGVAGGLASGSIFIGYKTTAGCSYGNEQSYNSNVSKTAMKKYTEAFNYLLANQRHKKVLDDITVVYWATGGKKNESCADLMSFLIFGDNDKMDEKQTEGMLDELVKSAREGNVTYNRISSLENIDSNVDFYMLGVKPNSVRISVKFIYRRKFGEILENIAIHQNDMQIGEKINPVPMWQLKKELVSPKSSNEKVDPSLLAEIFKAVIYGTDYPNYLLATLIRRVKTDKTINSIRAGAIKACINRKSRLTNKKEELTLALDLENTDQAYLCGRLFAVLERLQQAASNNTLNRTIKDAYFSSASSTPVLVFPRLINLAQHHLKKLNDKNRIFFSKLMQEIIGEINGEFKSRLTLAEQGRFIIGYYHQTQEFFKKKSTEKDDNTQQDNNTDNASDINNIMQESE